MNPNAVLRMITLNGCFRRRPYHLGPHQKYTYHSALDPANLFCNCPAATYKGLDGFNLAAGKGVLSAGCTFTLDWRIRLFGFGEAQPFGTTLMLSFVVIHMDSCACPKYNGHPPPGYSFGRPRVTDQYFTFICAILCHI